MLFCSFTLLLFHSFALSLFALLLLSLYKKEQLWAIRFCCSLKKSNISDSLVIQAILSWFKQIATRVLLKQNWVLASFSLLFPFFYAQEWMAPSLFALYKRATMSISLRLLFKNSDYIFFTVGNLLFVLSERIALSLANYEWFATKIESEFPTLKKMYSMPDLCCSI